MFDDHSTTTAAVVGLGTMGRGIARLLRANGLEVVAVDREPLTPATAASWGLDEVRLASSIAECVDGADIVFEAVFEDLDVKEEVLREISTATDAVIASNTSTFVPSVLAEFCVSPERLLVAHFFNPSDVVPLVEVVPHARSDEAITRGVAALLERMGKVAVVVRAERIGFVANRLQAAILREALSLVEEGVVSASGLDDVVRSGLAPRWAVAGPIGVADLGGLDIFATVCAEIFPTLNNAVVAPDILVEHVEAGELGAKSGRGFYRHDTNATRRAASAMAWMFSLQKNGKDLHLFSEEA